MQKQQLSQQKQLLKQQQKLHRGAAGFAKTVRGLRALPDRLFRKCINTCIACQLCFNKLTPTYLS